ncbi:MAG: hypothetical protein ABSD92_14265 [Candidatus Bathyarchaeia archaeon]
MPSLKWGRSLDRYDDGLQKQATGLLTSPRGMTKFWSVSRETELLWAVLG